LSAYIPGCLKRRLPAADKRGVFPEQKDEEAQQAASALKLYVVLEELQQRIHNEAGKADL
jgi:hypothetical protein